jgi:DNA-binding MarR family transcriptional regulator
VGLLVSEVAGARSRPKTVYSRDPGQPRSGALSHTPSVRQRPAAGSDGPRAVIDQQNYLPIFFTSIANTWSRGASKVFLSRYGLGFLDWVVMSMMAIEPRLTALRIRQSTSTDKAAVSRCLSQLEAKGLIVGAAEGRDPRRRTLELTPAGYEMHDKLMVIAVKREAQLLEGLDAREIATLIGLLTRVRKNVFAIQERDAAAVAADGEDVW